MRRSDADKPVAGRPAVPDQWTKFLLDRPVRGKVTELISKKEAWLDKGSAEGLLERMILTSQQHAWSGGRFVIAPEHMPRSLLNDLWFAQVQIEAVETNRCRIKCRFQDNELAVGQTVSSRLYE
jgi:hypothetical protein